MPEFGKQTVGATMKHIRKGALTTVTTSLPPDALLSQFGDVAINTYAQSMNLPHLNQKVLAARDLLVVPSPTSGEMTF